MFKKILLKTSTQVFSCEYCEIFNKIFFYRTPLVAASALLAKIAFYIKTASANLKVQSCKLYNNKYMIASIQITNTENFAFITVLVFKLLSLKVLFINRKANRNF